MAAGRDQAGVAYAASPMFYQYHHNALDTNNGSLGMGQVNADSIYNAARVTTVFTVYAFLAAVGDDHWHDPVTDHVPQLKGLKNQSHSSPDWHDIRLIDLASNLAGIAKDAVIDNVNSATLPSALASLVPAGSLNSGPKLPQSQQDFLHILETRSAVVGSSTTPILSNAAFQLLGLATENIIGKSLDVVFNDYIFEKLNMTSSTLGTPNTNSNAVIPSSGSSAGWDDGRSNESSTLAANFMYTTVNDLAKAGGAILGSKLLSPVSTNRWLKPFVQSLNPADDVGAPFSIYRSTLDGTHTGALVPIYTQFGTQGLYSAYLGLSPDWGVGFAVLSADTTAAADLNAYVDILAQRLNPALEKAAKQQADTNYAGNYSAAGISLNIVTDEFSGLSVANWTHGSENIRAAYAESYGLPPATLDSRLYPTDLSIGVQGSFRAVLQDKAAPVDAGTPTCITWMDTVDNFVVGGKSLDEFVFTFDDKGSAIALEVPALNVTLKRA